MVDLALVSSYYFPRWHGGPMRLAQSNGLLKIRNEMNALSDINDFFKPHPLWAEAIKTPQGFDVL
jgi:3-hydroxyacyl-CoA dehydrogenase